MRTSDLMGDLFDRAMSKATIEGVSVQAAELLAPRPHCHGLQGLASRFGGSAGVRVLVTE